MRHAITTIVLLGALSGSAWAALPQKAGSGKPPAQSLKEAPKAQPAIHAVRGVVKSVDASSLVIARSGRKAENLTFVLNPSTMHEGALAVGDNVSVRYRQDGKTLVATAVTGHAKKTASKSGQ
jgi:hypothetical protein